MHIYLQNCSSCEKFASDYEEQWNWIMIWQFYDSLIRSRLHRLEMIFRFYFPWMKICEYHHKVILIFRCTIKAIKYFPLLKLYKDIVWYCKKKYYFFYSFCEMWDCASGDLLVTIILFCCRYCLSLFEAYWKIHKLNGDKISFD